MTLATYRSTPCRRLTAILRTIGAVAFGLTIVGPLASPALAQEPPEPAPPEEREIAAELPPIIVTVDPRGYRTPDDLIQPISVLSGPALERRRAGTLGAVLDGLPGVADADFGPGVGRPVIRGLQGSRVQVLEDGLRTADVSGEGADHAIAIDPSRARQVEVLRGPATLLYGSGAAGGVVNVHTDRFDPDSEDVLSLQGRLTYGENGRDRQGRLGLEAPLGERLLLRADGNVRRTGDFSIDGFQQIDQTEGNPGRLRNSSIDSESLSATALLRGRRGHLGFGVSAWETDYGVPENFDARPLEQGGQSDEFERVFASYVRGDLRGELITPLPGLSAGRIKLAYTRFDQQEVEFEFDRTPAGGELAERIVEADFENDELEARLELVHLPVLDWQGVIGLQYNHRDFFADDPRAGDQRFYVRPNRTRTASLFVLEELPTRFGRVELGGRVERERASPDEVVGSRIEGVTGPDGGFQPLPENPAARSFTPVSLSAGTLVELRDAHHLRASIIRAQRSPSAEQLWSFGRHPAAGTFEVGAVDLNKETYLNLELGLDRHRGTVRYEVSLFYNRVDDFIFLQSEDDGTGDPVFVNDIGNRAGEGEAAGCVPGDGGLCRLRNQLVFNTQEDAELFGGELAATIDLRTGEMPLSLRLSADHVRGRLRSGGDLPRMTPTRVGVGLDTGYGDVQLTADYRRVFSQNRTAEIEEPTGGFNLLSFDLRWHSGGFGGAQLFVQGRNLLDEAGRLHQSFFRNEAPIVGRAFTTGLSFSI